MESLHHKDVPRTGCPYTTKTVPRIRVPTPQGQFYAWENLHHENSPRIESLHHKDRPRTQSHYTTRIVPRTENPYTTRIFPMTGSPYTTRTAPRNESLSA